MRFRDFFFTIIYIIIVIITIITVRLGSDDKTHRYRSRITMPDTTPRSLDKLYFHVRFDFAIVGETRFMCQNDSYDVRRRRTARRVQYIYVRLAHNNSNYYYINLLFPRIKRCTHIVV